jgi:hypothetical protein
MEGLSTLAFAAIGCQGIAAAGAAGPSFLDGRFARHLDWVRRKSCSTVRPEASGLRGEE